MTELVAIAPAGDASGVDSMARRAALACFLLQAATLLQVTSIHEQLSKLQVVLLTARLQATLDGTYGPNREKMHPAPHWMFPAAVGGLAGRGSSGRSLLGSDVSDIESKSRWCGGASNDAPCPYLSSPIACKAHTTGGGEAGVYVFAGGSSELFTKSLQCLT